MSNAPPWDGDREEMGCWILSPRPVSKGPGGGGVPWGPAPPPGEHSVSDTPGPSARRGEGQRSWQWPFSGGGRGYSRRLRRGGAQVREVQHEGAHTHPPRALATTQTDSSPRPHPECLM